MTLHPDKLVIATHNAGKLEEFRHLLTDIPFDMVSNKEMGVSDVAETGLTFVENALIKARNACAQTGQPALADDSGLEVDYLKGAPGIYSSRYAGANSNDQDNNLKLLEALDGVEHALRTARFRCCLVVLRHKEDPAPLICSGVWEGHIGIKAKGSNGFGYDPLFLPNDSIGSVAQLSAEQKQLLSHRAKALAELKLSFDAFISHRPPAD